MLESCHDLHLTLDLRNTSSCGTETLTMSVSHSQQPQLYLTLIGNVNDNSIFL